MRRLHIIATAAAAVWCRILFVSSLRGCLHVRQANRRVSRGQTEANKHWNGGVSYRTAISTGLQIIYKHETNVPSQGQAHNTYPWPARGWEEGGCTVCDMMYASVRFVPRARKRTRNSLILQSPPVHKPPFTGTHICLLCVQPSVSVFDLITSHHPFSWGFLSIFVFVHWLCIAARTQASRRCARHCTKLCRLH